MLSVGASSTMITPRLGIELAGYGPDLARRSRGVRDGLSAQALVLRGGSTEAALISMDLFGVSREFVAALRHRISEVTGILPQNVLVSASHVHTAPTAVATRAWGQPDPAYLEHLVERLADVTSTACRRLTPVAVQTMSATVPGITYNRVQGVPRDRTDGELTVTAFHRRDGPPGFEALALSFACHPVTLGPIDEVSADFPGEVRRLLLDRFRDSSVLYFSGACGDIDPSVNEVAWGSGTMDDVRHMGALLAQAAENALDQGARDIPGDDCELVVRTTNVELKYDLPAPETLEESIADLEARLVGGGPESDRPFGNVNERAVLPRFWLAHYRDVLTGLQDGTQASGETIEVQSICLSPIVRFIGVPAELYAESGLRIKREGKPHAVPICYANGLIGYLPPRQEYDRGSYTSTLAAAVNRRPPFVAGTAEQVERTIAQLIAEPT